MKRFFLETSRELWISLVILSTFWWLPPVLRCVDPTAAGLDLSVIQLCFLGAFRVYLAVIISWGLMRLLFPTVANWAAEGNVAEAWAQQRAWPELKGRVYLAVGLMAGCFLAALTALCLV